jgi:hypothetical protein
MATFSSVVVQGTTAVENFIRALVDGTHAIRYGGIVRATPGGMSPMDPTGGGYLFTAPTTGAAPARP